MPVPFRVLPDRLPPWRQDGTCGGGCGRLEWSCLDWNKPSIDFYTKKMQAVPMDEWTVYRLTGETLAAAAKPE